MITTITTMLQEASMSPVALPLAFVLGLISAVSSACCTLPAMGMLVAYSGTRQDTNTRAACLSAFSFIIGTSVALIILGLIAGFVGQAAQALLGKYWKLFAGVIAVVLGLAALKLLPVKLPQFARKAEKRSASHGIVGTVFIGLLMGGAVAASSLPCNPGIFIVLGASVLMGQILWGMILMAAFSVGFSLPLGAIFFGVSFGKMAIKAQKVEAAIRIIAGLLLVSAGFYLLATF
jgi:cytochrome c biogenesis protein CcdA